MERSIISPDQEMREYAEGRCKHCICSEFRSANNWNEFATACDINGISDRTKKDQEASPEKVWIPGIKCQFTKIGKSNSCISENKRNLLY